MIWAIVFSRSCFCWLYSSYIFNYKEYNQSDFGVDHLVMPMCGVFSCVYMYICTYIHMFTAPLPLKGGDLPRVWPLRVWCQSSVVRQYWLVSPQHWHYSQRPLSTAMWATWCLCYLWRLWRVGWWWWLRHAGMNIPRAQKTTLGSLSVPRGVCWQWTGCCHNCISLSAVPGI